MSYEGGETVLVRCGPVVGRVTQNSAIVLLEVDTHAEITGILISLESGEEFRVSKVMKANIPGVFVFEDLPCNTKFKISFEGIAPGHLDNMVCEVKTLPNYEDITRLRFVAMSCDRFSRLDENDENPWGRVLGLVQEGKVDAMLHLGDQVYTSQWGYLTRATNALARHDFYDRNAMMKMKLRAMEYIRDAYRDTWTMPECRQVLAQSQHLMIWSDNDVANDFTILKKEDGSGDQAYSDEFLMCGMKVYREYQRQLWDPWCEGKLPAPHSKLEEWQFHTFGPCGVFLVDMRGNRITPRGVQQERNPLMSERQREALEAAFRTEGITCMLVCSEIPFVGDEPPTIKEKAKKQAFLADHWPYNDEELIFVLDLCFNWKAEVPGREVLLLGGDIHVGVDSIVSDAETGMTIRHLTTSPITNHVCPFFPDLEGRISDRYSFQHSPMPELRNYATIDIRFDPLTKDCIHIDAKLNGVPTVAMLKKKKETQGDSHEHPFLVPVHPNQRVYQTHSLADEDTVDGILNVKIFGAKGLPDTGHLCPMMPECHVRLMSEEQRTPPAGEDERNPEWDEVLSFNYDGEHSMRITIFDSGNNIAMSHADFSLTPFLKGWRSFTGELPLYQNNGASGGLIHISVMLNRRVGDDE